MRIDIRPVVTSTFTGLKATGMFKSIVLNWTLPADMENYRATEIWWSGVNALGTAVKLDTVNGNAYTVTVDDTDVRYFWVREVNQYGRTDGEFSTVVFASGKALATGDFENVVFDLASAQVVGELSKERITGLGALAALDRAGVADITGLGSLATQNYVAADVIGAGILATGVVYAGVVEAHQVNATSLDAITATIGILRTQTSGGRVEIQDNRITVYDTTNALRVVLGSLS
jgi:hypothetical protein